MTDLVEDVSDLVGIISPYETPLLDALGDSLRETNSIHHEWLEDILLPNKGILTKQASSTSTNLRVKDGNIFRVGDQIQAENSKELMLVKLVSDFIGVIRGYAGTKSESLEDGQIINILGNAVMEGADNPTKRFTARIRSGNYTHRFIKEVMATNGAPASSQLGRDDELDYQKQEVLRELLRELEKVAILGDNHNHQTRGIVHFVKTNKVTRNELTEDVVNEMLRTIWETSAGNVDLIVVGGFQKRKMNIFLNRKNTGTNKTYADAISIYESDFGVIRIVATRWMPQDSVLFLDSSRINVLPLAGNSFHFKLRSENKDFSSGEIIGEYTLELKNEAAHGLISGLSIG